MRQMPRHYPALEAADLLASYDNADVCSPVPVSIALDLRACSSCRLYFRRRTVKFFGWWQIRSNCVRTSFICLINSLVLGD